MQPLRLILDFSALLCLTSAFSSAIPPPSKPTINIESPKPKLSNSDGNNPTLYRVKADSPINITLEFPGKDKKELAGRIMLDIKQFRLQYQQQTGYAFDTYIVEARSIQAFVASNNHKFDIHQPCLNLSFSPKDESECPRLTITKLNKPLQFKFNHKGRTNIIDLDAVFKDPPTLAVTISTIYRDQQSLPKADKVVDRAFRYADFSVDATVPAGVCEVNEYHMTALNNIIASLPAFLFEGESSTTFCALSHFGSLKASYLNKDSTNAVKDMILEAETVSLFFASEIFKSREKKSIDTSTSIFLNSTSLRLRDSKQHQLACTIPESLKVSFLLFIHHHCLVE